MKYLKCLTYQLGMVSHACDPNTLKAEAGELSIRGQVGLNDKTLSEKKFNFQKVM